MQMESQVLQVNLDDIIPNRFQPRIAFDEQGLKELSDSIKEHGIIQPLVLRKLGNKYEIIAGERRYKAATMAGLTTVPAVISNMDDNKSAEVAIVENIQRRDLTSIEEAKSYKSLLDKGYLTQEQLAKKMGVSQSAVANKLRLLNLDDEVQQALLAEKISERHARSLLQIENKEEQKKWLNRIINERLTVRHLDQEIKRSKNVMDGSEIPTVDINPNIDSIRANAHDINAPTEKRSVDSMMVPESVLTDYGNSNSQEPAVTDQPETINDSPVIESVNEPVKPNSENKFFNFTDIDPEEIEIPAKKEEPVDELEIIDIPSPIEETVVEEDKEEPVIAGLDVKGPETLDISFNPNNRFFTPTMDESNKSNDILIPQREIVIDPMSVVEQLDPEYEQKQTEKRELELIDGVKEIRSTIESLKKRGFDVKVEEIDFDSNYQLIIQIEKGN